MLARQHLTRGTPAIGEADFMRRDRIETVRQNLIAIEGLLTFEHLSATTRADLENYREELILKLRELIGAEEKKAIEA